MFLGFFLVFVYHYEIQRVEFFGPESLRGAQDPQFMCLSPLTQVHATLNRHLLRVFEVLGTVQVLCGPKFCAKFDSAVKSGPDPRKTAESGTSTSVFREPVLIAIPGTCSRFDDETGFSAKF